MRLPLIVRATKATHTTGLIDSGAGGDFIDQRFAQAWNLPLEPLSTPLPVLNADGTPNERGDITHEAITSLT